MTKNWWNDYVGIPYASKGRDRSGVDCWGLVRLVGSEQFGRQLPGFDDLYADERDFRSIEEAVAQHVEGWERAANPEPGDAVFFKIKGHPVHIGVSIGSGKFLHAREGAAVCVERLDSGAWRHRVEGFYRYVGTSASRAVTVSAVPHPLQTRRISVELRPGMTLAEVVRAVELSGQVDTRVPLDHLFMIDGKRVPTELLDKTVTLPGQRIEYRAVPRGSGAGQALMMIAILVVAWYAAPLILGYGTGAAGWAAAGAAGATMSVAMAAGAIGTAGMMLTQAIFPTRMPAQAGPETLDQQYGINGGSNPVNQYGAIPVVLGRMRFTPPVGALPYNEAIASETYLRLIVVWGYGPLQISDIRVGAEPIGSLEEVEHVTLNGYDDSSQDVSAFNKLYAYDTSQEAVNVLLESDGTLEGSPWIERVISDPCDRISVTLNFPEGLRAQAAEGGNAGKISPASFRGYVQVRQLDSETLAPIESWGSIQDNFKGGKVNIQPAWFNVDSDEALEKVYRWTRISLDEHNKMVVREGCFTTSAGSTPPTGNVLLRQQQAAYGITETFERLPAYGPGEEPLWDVQVYGNDIIDTVDRRGTAGADVTGCALTVVNDSLVVVGVGSIARAQQETLKYGATGEPYCQRKTPFTVNVSFDVPHGVHEVRVRRSNDDEKDFEFPSGNAGKRFHDCYLVGITGFESRRPVVAPSGVKLAMTAIRVKATNQVNGTLEGITATCQVICKDWDSGEGAWVVRPTRNPASLIRHVLQHPGNAKRVPDSGLDLAALQSFHTWCRTNKFMYDQVRTSAKSVLDTVRDIAAAGRASPTIRDGKWTVVIDRPRTDVAQHFTPHNSYGFEGSKLLPKVPHGFRVKFNNAEKGYQPDEMIVYNDGYSAMNATLFEALEFPGVTTPAHVFKHARFHLAQVRLRSETYTLNADVEHLVCTRGDLVRVTHDVPMWGLASGRIKELVGSFTAKLEEQVPMDGGKQYAIRFRNGSGVSYLRTVEAKPADGWYDTVTVTVAINSSVDAGDLFMFGELASETAELVVLGIEPSDNMTARIRLADYAPAVYDADVETIPAFDSQITMPPKLLQPTIKHVPTVAKVVSDESVMARVGPSQFEYAIKVSLTNPTGSGASDLTHVEGQIDFAEDSSLNWSAPQTFPRDAALFRDVQEGDSYRIRLRYVNRAGFAGPWGATITHTVVGKKNKPATVAGLAASASLASVVLNWDDNREPDLAGYEVREANANWGESTGRLFRGAASGVTLKAPSPPVAKTFYVKAFDVAGNFSTTAASVLVAVATPPTVTGLAAAVSDTALSDASVLFTWNEAAPLYGLDYYLCVLTLPDASTREYVARASEWRTDMNWVGSAQLAVSAVDLTGASSTPATLSVTKSLPSQVAVVSKTVKNASLTMDWPDNVKTTLAVAGYEVRTTDTNWGSGSGFLYRGIASLCTITMVPGANTFYVRAFDTDGNYSAASRTVTQTYDIPPNVTSLVLARVGPEVVMTANGGTQPADFKHYEFRIDKNGVGDVWATGYDDYVRSGSRTVQWRPPSLGTYRVAVRMVDLEGNISLASAEAAITIAQIPAP